MTPEQLDDWLQLRMAQSPAEIDDVLLELRRFAIHRLPLSNRVQLVMAICDDIVDMVSEFSCAELPLDLSEDELLAAVRRLLRAQFNRVVQLDQPDTDYGFYGIVPEPSQETPCGMTTLNQHREQTDGDDLD